MGFRIPQHVKWTFLLCVIIGSVVLAVVRIRVARRIRERYSKRKRSGTPALRSDLPVRPDVAYHLYRIQTGDYHVLCADPHWRDAMLWYSDYMKDAVHRHIYWVDGCVRDANGPLDAVRFFLSEDWRRWIARDYVVVITERQTLMFNVGGLVRSLRRGSPATTIRGRFVVGKMSFLPRLYHR
jgi:hypothetical protein